MRQSKLSELIHNSAEHPNCDHCAVEVHFRDIVDTVCSFNLFKASFTFFNIDIILARFRRI